jgi:hypothetical protein
MMSIASNTRREATGIALAAAAFVCAGMTGAVQAQSKNLGTYTGAIEVSGTQSGPEVAYRARVKVSMPVSSRDGSSINAEFLAGEAPNATVLVSQWDISHKEKSADSGGQFNSYTCSLAAPAEIPMAPTGVLNVNLKAKKHALSLTLLSTKDLDFNCKHSRSGPYKKKGGIALYIGTGVPGMHYETQLPFTDAAHLTAKYTLMPTAETKGQHGPIIQEWDLKLTR